MKNLQTPLRLLRGISKVPLQYALNHKQACVLLTLNPHYENPKPDQQFETKVSFHFSNGVMDDKDWTKSLAGRVALMMMRMGKGDHLMDSSSSSRRRHPPRATMSGGVFGSRLSSLFSFELLRLQHHAPAPVPHFE